MDRNRQSNGLETFLEHWGILVTVLVAAVAGKLLTWLSGVPWIWLRAAAFTLMIGGAALVAYARLPAHGSGRFFTFGIKTIPHHLRGCYQWGWRIFLFGVVLGCFLLVSRP